MRAQRWPLVVALVLLVAVALLAVAIVGGVTLARAAPNPTGPTGITFYSGLGAYDAATGYDLWLLVYGSTWTYAHGVWSNITSTAGIPTDMTNNVRLVYDAHDGYVLLYGGSYTYTGSFGITYDRPLSNTWAFERGRWTNLTSTVRGAPPPRILGLMAYDSEDQAVVLFGGSRINASSLTGAASINETWTYAGGVWTNATVSGPPPLSGSFGAIPFFGFVDDPADGYLLYYNALAHPRAIPGSATWTYRGGVWTNRTETFGPAPDLFAYGGFAYDSTSQTVIVVGTCVSTAGFTCEHHDGGTFQFSGGTWKDVTPGTSPPARETDGFLDDPPDGGIVMAGGCCWVDPSGLFVGWQDVWVYSHGEWTESDPWGGAAPSWIQNDGSLAAMALGLVAAVSIGTALTKRPPSSP